VRSFRFLLSSTALSNLADGVLKVGTPLLAVSLTRSPSEVALVGVAATLPWLVFALLAGALADRVDRRAIMVAANAGRTLVLAAAGLLAATGTLTLPVMLVALLLASGCEVFADLSAQSVLPMTVGRGELVKANGRVQTAQMLGNEFLGSPVAGILVTLAPAAVFGTSGILYGAAGALLLGMRGAFRPAQERPRTAPVRSVRADIAEALRLLWGHRFLRTLAISAGLMNFAGAAYFAVFVLWVVGPGSRLGLDPSGYGPVITVLAVGAVAGSLLSEPVTRRVGERAMLVGAWLANGLLLVVPVAVPSVWALYPTAFLLGLAGAAGNVLVIATRQRLIPGELLGRVNAAYRLFGTAGQPVGAALAGVVGEHAGLPAVFYGAAAVSIIAVVRIMRVPRDHISVPLTRDAVNRGGSRSR
jgi:MFS family permease